jgi:hypothetical protein
MVTILCQSVPCQLPNEDTAGCERPLCGGEFGVATACFWPVSDRRRRPALLFLSLGLFSHLQSVIHFNAKIPHSALELGMAEEQLDSPQILCASVNQRSLAYGYHSWQGSNPN